MSMITRNHNQKICHNANLERMKLICQLKCLASQLNECDRRPLKPFPKTEKRPVNYEPTPVSEPLMKMICYPEKSILPSPPTGIVNNANNCSVYESCKPGCGPCNLSISDLCKTLPQWLRDEENVEMKRKPLTVAVCEKCLEDLNCAEIGASTWPRNTHR